MKSIKKQVWAVYQNDGCQGYSVGLPLALYPFQSAAQGSEEAQNQRGYSNIEKVNLCCFEDVCFIYEKEIQNNSILGSCGIGAPVNGYRVEYIPKGGRGSGWGNNNDKTVYIIGENHLVEFLKSDLYRATVYKTFLTRDESEYFELKYLESFKVNSFVMSRELAIKNALSKLTTEEQKLLGLDAHWT